MEYDPGENPGNGEQRDSRWDWGRLANRLGALSIRAMTLLGQSLEAYGNASTAAVRGAHLFGSGLVIPLDMRHGCVAMLPDDVAEPVADVSGLDQGDAADVRYLFEECLTGVGLSNLILDRKADARPDGTE